MRLRRAIAGLLTLLALPVAAHAATPDRVLRASVSASGDDADGLSRRPDLSGRGRLVVFESTATNLAPDPNGAVRDVFQRDLKTGQTAIVSDVPGVGANGPSGAATVASAGGVVAFESDATNLGPADTNGATDVFVRTAGQPIQRVSLRSDGAEAAGRSFEPDISAAGRFVAFTSSAANLVAGDDNNADDVFVRDLLTNATRRVSSGNGASRAPAISPDGRWVSFTSTSSDILNGDTNGVADVFLADLERNVIRRVSVSSRGRQQNRAVAEPFFIVSDVSEDGRYVAFDSDATNLVRRDTNQDTDVFVHDREDRSTERVSLTVLSRQADNDSYFPAISPDGRYVGFSSYAGNIWPKDQAGEDVFLHDRRLRATTLLTARESGAPVKEKSKQLLRRPAITLAAEQVAFTSTAALVNGDGNGIEDIFIRSTEPAEGRFLVAPPRVTSSRRPEIRLRAKEPTAQTFLCRLDGRPLLCPRDGRLPRLSLGRHTLSVRAGGPGLRFDPTPLVTRFRVR